MIFDVYHAYQNKKGVICPGIKPEPLEWNKIVANVLNNPKTAELVIAYRATGNPEFKKRLDAICFVGSCKGGTRAARNMLPTQLVMIDIDHCDDPKASWLGIRDRLIDCKLMSNLYICHITPSGHGLHLILSAVDGCTTLKDCMDYYNTKIQFSDFGDYDSVVHDFARLSFAFPASDLLFESALLIMDTAPALPQILINPNFEVATTSGDKEGSKITTVTKTKDDIPQYTEDEAKQLKAAEWRGIPLSNIIQAWVEYRGEPGPQEIHNYYNEMVKYFRNIMGNNRRLIFYLLPKFGHTDDECWSQVVSITRSNTLSQIDKPFYFWLRDNGFYVSTRNTSVDKYILDDTPETDILTNMPKLPPVFRELVNTAPKDYKVPAINALLPILGTLTSYLQAIYPYDDAYHTTSFFSIIYAPPGTGKGFVSRFNWLFDDLRLRDLVQSARENVYLRVISRKGDNEKSPELPHVSLRIIPPKNSEAEFLQKQKDNQGYHMFTYAAEMDSWAKGEKAAGGNKSDMIRIAWDNGEYGQQFKSANTFKGMVRLFWNVLITGTQAQVESYFKNVENGLVTRCSFTSIDNQEFAMAAEWKSLSKKSIDLIKKFLKRCDENTYEEPCEINPIDIEGVSDEDFDKEINWRFKFRPRRIVDISWIMPVIDDFHRSQCQKASKDLDRARDVFRRRVGVRGFRLALLCTALYTNLNKRNIDTIKGFVKWWMQVDLDNMLKLWGAKYNDQAEVTPHLYNRNAFGSLKDNFTRSELFAVLKQQNIKTPLRIIIYQWHKNGFIEKVSKDEFKKIKK